jgi:hypothetical protein
MPPEIPVTRTAGFFSSYRDNAVQFNRNLITARAGGFFASSYVSQLYAQYGSSDLANSVAALAVEYCFYITAFATPFYFGNRSKYVDPATGRLDSRRLRQDIKKLFAAFAVCELVSSIPRFLTQHGLLQTGSQPYEASTASSPVAWGAFFVAINSMSKTVGLFRH